MKHRQVEPELVFGVARIMDVCGHPDCDESAVSVLTMLAQDRGAEVMFVCPEHGDRLDAAVEGSNTEVQQINRTCGLGDVSPCGAAATHISVIGYRDTLGAARLGAVSICERHAEEYRKQVGD